MIKFETKESCKSISKENLFSRNTNLRIKEVLITDPIQNAIVLAK
jgi:hypothetical protein